MLSDFNKKVFLKKLHKKNIRYFQSTGHKKSKFWLCFVCETTNIHFVIVLTAQYDSPDTLDTWETQVVPKKRLWVPPYGLARAHSDRYPALNSQIVSLFCFWNTQYARCDPLSFSARRPWHVRWMRNTHRPKETAVGTSIWVSACPFWPLFCSKQPNFVSVLLLKHPICTLRPSKFLSTPALTCKMDTEHTQTQRHGCGYPHMGQRVLVLTVILLLTARFCLCFASETPNMHVATL